MTIHPSISYTIGFFVKHHKKMAFAVIFFLLLENLVLVYDNIQNKAPILGVRVEGSWIIRGRANLTRFVQNRITENDRPLRFIHENKIISISQKELGAKIDVPVVVNQILQKGRKGNVFEKIIEQNKALIGFSNVKIQGTLSPALLAIKILEIKKDVDRDALPRRPDITGNPKAILPEKEGEKVQVDKLTLLIMQNTFDPPPNPIQIPTYKDIPNTYKDSDIKKVQSDFSKISLEPISITSGGLTFTLTTNDIKSLLTIVERPDPKNSKKSVLSIRLDSEKLKRKLGDFAEKIEQATGAEFDHDDAPSAIYSQFYTNTRKPVELPIGNRINKGKVVLGASTLGGQKTVYLTFDDGPNSIYHPLILDILKNYNVKVTFFLVGQNINRDRAIAKRTFTEGNIIGNHTLDHIFLPNYSSSVISGQIQSTDAILKSITGQDPTLFRPPYGGVNSYVTYDAQALGLKLYLWDVDPKDWTEPDAADLVQRVVSNTFDGANILMHSNHLATVKALPQIIETLKARGYTFKTL